MKPLGQLIESWEPQPSEKDDPLVTIRSLWPSIVGEDVAANSRPSQLAHGGLLVLTRSSAWSQQLAFLSERILAAVRDRTGLAVERLKFRTGRLCAVSIPLPRKGAVARRKPVLALEPAVSVEEAFDRFRSGVAAAGRAKARKGWKECRRCGVRVLPSPGPFCVPCENERQRERQARVARLLFDVPWLGYEGLAPLVGDLTRAEYESMRIALLRRWSDALERVRRSGGKRITSRDRMMASSYVLLKSEIDPENIAPAVVRDLLGDELHDIFYGHK